MQVFSNITWIIPISDSHGPQLPKILTISTPAMSIRFLQYAIPHPNHRGDVHQFDNDSQGA